MLFVLAIQLVEP